MASSNPVDLLLDAYRYDDVEAVLRILARGLLAEGMTLHDVVAAFEEARTVLQADGRDADEEYLLDVLDALHWWAPPGKSI